MKIYLHKVFRFCFYFLLNVLGVTSVNKIIYVSSIQFYYTSSVYGIVYSPPQVRSPQITIYPCIHTSSTFPLLGLIFSLHLRLTTQCPLNRLQIFL